MYTRHPKTGKILWDDGNLDFTEKPVVEPVKSVTDNLTLGYYTIGDKIFTSKVEACLHATKVYNQLQLTHNIDPKQIIKWHFHNDVFSKYNWKLESEKSLDELYDERAKNLRQQYDYIIVSYSGGADSHNVVMSFLRQNLHIDEIVVTYFHEITKNYSVVDPNNTLPRNFHEAEYQLQIRPRLQELSAAMPRTKISILDTTQSVIDFFDKNSDESWIFKVREELNPVDAARYNLSKFAAIERNLDTNKKIAIIMGVDKAKVKIDERNNEVFIQFIDRTTNQVPIGEHLKQYNNVTMEFFYWSPNACELLCKQAHTVKKWLEENEFLQKFFKTNFVRLKDHRVVTDRILRNVLYSTWKKEWFQSDKCQHDWYAEHDEWFIQGLANTVQHSLWQSGINFVITHCEPYLQYYLDNKKMPDGLLRWTQSYSIGYLYNIKKDIENNLSSHWPISIDITETELQTEIEKKRNI